MFTHRTSVLLCLFVIGLVALPAAADGAPTTLPRLVDLGAGKCIPCKKMAPILEEMQKDYAGVVDIVFLDVWKDPKAAKPYRIRVIPTQVFYDAAGREVFRHEGFYSREEIEKVFSEKMGVKTIVPPQNKAEGKLSGSLLPGSWESDAEDTGTEAIVSVGDTPNGPPLRLHVVYASVACACVMERCERLGRTLRELMDPRGAAVVQVWTDRMEDPDKADSLMLAWGLGYLPAIALVDPSGRPYYGDDEELDLETLAGWLEQAL